MASIATPRRTLVDVLLPRQRSVVLDAVLVVVFSAFVGLTAQVAIPLWPVPLTLTTLGVLFTGATLGSKRGALALLLYLAEGAAGLPVFAGGASGVAYMLDQPVATSSGLCLRQAWWGGSPSAVGIGVWSGRRWRWS